MVRFKSSRGFILPVMVVGFVLVGLLAIFGTINLFKTPATSSKTASQTIQSNSVQKIADDNTSPCLLSPNITISPCEVSGKTDKVSITFTNLPDPKKENETEFKYFYCLKSSLKDCGEDDWHNMYKPGLDNKGNTIAGDTGQSIFNSLCGDGSKTLKTDCKQGRDWFHVGSTYRVFLAQGTSKSTLAKNTSSNVMAVASFYVRHFYPQVIEPISSDRNPQATPIPMPGYNVTTIKEHGSLDINITLQGRDNSEGSTDSNNKNDYFLQVIAHDSDYKFPAEGSNTSCLYIPNAGNAAQGKKTLNLKSSYTDPAGNEIPLDAGSYVLRIEEGKDGNTDPGNAKCAEGVFTYWDIPFSIGGTDNEGISNKEVRYPGYMANPVQDPYGKETGPSEFMVTPKPICTQHDQNGYCTSIPTAIGPVHTEPRAFVGDIFSIVLSIGGIAAILFFIQAGYTLMTSAGNKEKVGAAREQITAAIMGLLFIILSITILDFIGINILHIPGFK